MAVRALFPGTFDPVHLGHIDIARRAARLFDEVVVAVYDRPLKSLMFSPEERLHMVEVAFQGDPNIRVTGYNTLTVDFCHEIGAQVIVRGLRVFSDFEYEFQLAMMNRRLEPELETVFLMTGLRWVFLSSSILKEAAVHGGDIAGMVPEIVFQKLREKFGLLK